MAKRRCRSSDDKTIRLWDLAGARTLKIFRDHKNYVLSVAFAPGGGRFLSAGGGQWRGPNFATESDQFVRLWDLDSAKVVRRLEGHTAPVWSLACADDGKTALSCSGGFEFKG